MANNPAAEHPLKVLLATNEFNRGISEWRKRDGFWSCARADSCLSFLLKTDPVTAKFELLKRGYEWEWI